MHISLRISIFLAALLGMASAQAAPVNWIQGAWNGICTRGHTTVNAHLYLASSGGTLNTKPISGLNIKNYAISFTESTHSFQGNFSTDYNQLTGALGKDNKAASCTMTRLFKESDTLCMENDTAQDIYVWLDSPNGQGGAPFWLRAASKTTHSGDRTGRVCFSGTEFVPPKCPVFIPQKTYSCQE
jgi:hypothetical protein